MKKIVLGSSWKMHKTLREAEQYIHVLKDNLDLVERFRVFLAVAFPYLLETSKMVAGTSIMITAQNMHWEEKGAYTGEISAAMLEDVGVQMVIVGHPERKAFFNETDYTVNLKLITALKHNLIPLIVVGENREEKECGITEETISRQIKIALHGVEIFTDRPFYIAYEPIWAIGDSGVPADPAYAEKIHAHIRKVLRDLFSNRADEIPIIYGGNVNLKNCTDFLRKENVDGLFLGRSSYDPHAFIEIAQRIDAIEAATNSTLAAPIQQEQR